MKQKINKGMHYVAVALIMLMSIVVLACEEPTPNEKDVSEKAVSCLISNDEGTRSDGPDPVLVQILKNKKVPCEIDLVNAYKSTKDIFAPYKDFAGKELEAVYISPQGAGTKDGMSWENAKAGDGAGLKTIIDDIDDASDTKIYILLLSSGTYKPAATLSMKNHVAIVGGWNELSLTRNPDKASTIDGQKNKQVFSNSNIGNTASLYGVTISNGHVAGYGGGMYNNGSSPILTSVIFSENKTTIVGGGMYNTNSSSPKLTSVIFSANTATNGGGGMYNDGSSPILTSVIFSGNTADSGGGGGGGGMYNTNSSSPKLTSVIFSANSTSYGGGMYNTKSSSPILTSVIFSANSASYSAGGMLNERNSSPILTSVIFSANTASRGNGGGMHNTNSSPILTSVIFSANTATNGGGGGMYNNLNNGKVQIVNSIFWGNTEGSNNESSQIYVYNDSGANKLENIAIHNSILQGGIEGISYLTAPVGSAQAENTELKYSSIIEADPLLSSITYEGVSIPTPTAGSSAINQGLYVRANADYSKFYYSTDNTTWYDDLLHSSVPGSAGTSIVLPTQTIDLTATDITGYVRTDKPDIGAYEFR